MLACAAARARRHEERLHRRTGKDLLLPAGTARYVLPSKPFAQHNTCAVYEIPVPAIRSKSLGRCVQASSFVSTVVAGTMTDGQVIVSRIVAFSKIDLRV